MQRLLAPLFLLPALAAMVAHGAPSADEKARAEIQRQLQELAPPSPAVVEVTLEGLGIEGYTLDDAEFELDGAPLATGAPEQLHAKGLHRLLIQDAKEGDHTLLVRLVYRNTDAPFLSQLAGYRWKLASSVRFEAQRGLKVQVTIRPAFIPGAPDLPQRFTLSHRVGAEMLAPLAVETRPASGPQPGTGAMATPAIAVVPAQPTTAPAVAKAPEALVKIAALARRRAVAATVRFMGPVVREVALGRGDRSGRQASVPPGRYTVQVVAPGYLAQMRQVELAAGKEMALDFQLTRSPNRPAVKVKEGKLEVTPALRFAVGAKGLTSASRASLSQVVDALVLHDLKRLRIEGHTDGREARGREVALSLARASAVKDALVKAGVDPERLEVKSMGSTRPVAPNVTKRGRDFNRRVELVILDP